MDILDHLMHEHREAEQLLQQLADSEEGSEREQLVEALTEALSKHMAVEEQFVYPIAADVLDDEQVSEANTEHDLARDGITKLRELVATPGFGAAVAMVTAGIQHHVREEEGELFPQLRQRAADQLAELDPESLEQQVMANAGGRSRSRTGGSRGAGDGDATKEELYQRAQEADIPGRSQMTKEELAAALAEQ